MKKVYLARFVCLATFMAVAACSTQQSTPNHAMHSSAPQQQIKSYFDAANTQGVMVIQHGSEIAIYGNDLARANKQYVPASTFKILNALIALDQHKANLDEIFKWDGKKHSNPAWQKDMNLSEAMQVSALPVYQLLARRIGLNLMAEQVQRAGFGNAYIGSQIDQFWLNGSLKISPLQELEFVDRLAHKTLPFPAAVQQQVQNMIFIKQINGHKIYAKTGWGVDVQPAVGWFSGWVEQADGNIVAFSLNLEMKEGLSGTIRTEIAYKALASLGII